MVKKAAPRKRVADWQARPRWRITRGDQIALGPGKADLLEAIHRTRAISRAASELDMSYRRAWMLVSVMNESFVGPVVRTSTWRGKGASLTPLGVRALRIYRQLESSSLAAGRGSIRQLETLLRGPGVAGRSRRRDGGSE